MKNILVVEDHEEAMDRMCQIVSKAFQKPNIECAKTVHAAKEKILESFFDLAIVDLALPDGNGEDVVKEIKSRFSNTYIVISTIHDESERLLTALENGANGFLLKEQSVDQLVSEFQGILLGKPPLAPAITRRLMEMVKSKGGNHQDRNAVAQLSNVSTTRMTNSSEFDNLRLTSRETEILKLIAKGHDRSAIAKTLNISHNTVSSHISKIYSKLDIRNRAEASLVAHKLDLI